MLQLYTYYRSVSSHRVRIALNYKQIPYKSIFIDEDSGQQQSEEYLHMNPQGLIPTLLVKDRYIITQSAAILEYLEERYPERPLLPADIDARAQVRSFAQVCIADVQPMNVLRVYHYMRDVMQLDREVRRAWYEHWAHKGLRAMESLLAQGMTTGDFCHGDRPSIADVCLVPQLFNAEHNRLDLAGYPILRRIYRNCMALSAFQSAGPETQRDRLQKALAL